MGNLGSTRRRYADRIGDVLWRRHRLRLSDELVAAFARVPREDSLEPVPVAHSRHTRRRAAGNRWRIACGAVPLRGTGPRDDPARLYHPDLVVAIDARRRAEQRAAERARLCGFISSNSGPGITPSTWAVGWATTRPSSPPSWVRPAASWVSKSTRRSLRGRARTCPRSTGVEVVERRRRRVQSGAGGRHSGQWGCHASASGVARAPAAGRSGHASGHR